MMEQKKIAIELLNLKQFNRSILHELETRRKVIDERKEIVDKLHLDLENLLYKQAYLRREIKNCRDLFTPNVSSIENEINTKLGTLEYSDELCKTYENAFDILEQEKEHRKRMQSDLDNLKQKRQASIDKLDRKRKFLEELPTRVSTVKTATNDLQTLFNAVLQEAPSST
jgi:chromosome segregation ATPase